MLLLGADRASCRVLRQRSAPACGWSSLLRSHTRRLRDYAVGQLQLIWLQRWYYLLRLVSAGLNAMMLD